MSNSGGVWNCQACGHLSVVCEICGFARHSPASDPTEILQGSLFLGDYNSASRRDLRDSLGITRTLNIISSPETFFSLELLKGIELIEKCVREGKSVLVYCITGINRSAAVVIGYLMKSRHWILEHSLQYVRDRRPSVDLDAYKCLQLYGHALNGTNYNFPPPTMTPPHTESVLSPTFSIESSNSIPGGSPSSVPPNMLITGDGQANPNIAGSSRIDAPKYNFLRTRAPNYSSGNAEGFRTPTFSTRTGNSIPDGSPSSVPPNKLITGVVQANPNIAGSSRIGAPKFNFLGTLAPYYSFGNAQGFRTPTFSTRTGNSIPDGSPSSVPPNVLITGAVQANPNIAGSSRIGAPKFKFLYTRAPNYSFGNAQGFRIRAFSTRTGNSIPDGSPSSVPPNKLITGAGQATEASLMANQANPKP